MGVAISKK